MRSREEFLENIHILQRALEVRRKRYMMLWGACLVLACGIGGGAPRLARPLLAFLSQNFLHRSTPPSVAEESAFLFFAGLCVILFVTYPLIRFRGGVKAQAPLGQLVLLRLCEAMGTGLPLSPLASIAYLARGSGIFPEDTGFSERGGIGGEEDGLRFSFQELSAASGVGGHPQCLFRGVYITCRKRLLKQQWFVEDRRTLVLHRDHSALTRGDVFGDYPVEILEADCLHREAFGCISTHAEAMRPTITDAWFTGWLLLAQRAYALPARPIGWDSRLAQRFLVYAKERRERSEERGGSTRTQAEREYDASFCPSPTLDALPASGTPMAQAMAIAFRGGALSVAMPCNAQIFAQPSLFHSAFSEEEALWLYDSVDWIQRHAFAYNA